MTALTDGSGAIAERYAYNAYGEPVFTNASGTVLAESAKDNRYTYTGREWDEELSLYHFRARMYDAESGRFCGRDPLAYIDGSGLYMFAKNSPIVRMDSSGLSTDFPKAHPKEGEDEASSLFNDDCASFWNDNVGSNESAKECWKGFVDATETLPEEQRNKCRGRVKVTCTCKCPAFMVAGQKDGELFFCSDKAPFLGRDVQGAAQQFCHELQHLLRTSPCTQGGRDPNGKQNCLEMLKEETIAYHCAGQCIGPQECAARAKGSVLTHCEAQELTELLFNDASAYWMWIRQNAEKFGDNSICRGIVYKFQGGTKP